MNSFDKKAWDLMLKKLFCEKTSLFYDFLIPEMNFEDFLPDPELIKRQIPNPCGWCTGMEDSMINGSIMLDAAIDSYRLYGDESFIEIARKIFKGLKLCASVSQSEGFLARSVSPVDSKTHYIESSRDQYTHWILSSVNYLKSGMATDEEKSFIKSTLRAFARRALANVTEKTDYNMLREDGTKSIATCMWKTVSPHEWMRLPMFYLAAWKISGDENFKEEYLKLRDEALLHSEEIDLDSYKRLFAIHQMQISLRFVYDYDTDENFRQRCLKLMEKVAIFGRNKIIALATEHADKDILKGNYYNLTPWNKLTAEFWGYLDGYAYYVPRYLKSNFSDFLADLCIYNVGDGASLYTLLPDADFDEQLLKAVELFGESIDYEAYSTDTVGHLLSPYYQLKLNKTLKGTV